MVLLLRRLYGFYKWANEDIKDPRTQHYPLVGSPFPIILFLVLYNMLVQCWGPKYMAKRKPFKLDRVLIVYNLFQVVASGYFFLQCLRLGWGGQMNYFCEPLDHSITPHTEEIAFTVYLYFWLKVIDLLDTVFFVMRKKFGQVSFLHLYHHTGMVALSWGAVKWMPGGHDTFLGFVNSFVHVIMYSYYLVTALQPQYKQNIWWKKHITQLQMLQFFLFILHSVSLLVAPDCGYPKFTAGIFIPQNLFMLLLFYDFYKKAYFNKKEKN